MCKGHDRRYLSLYSILTKIYSHLYTHTHTHTHTHTTDSLLLRKVMLSKTHRLIELIFLV